MLRRIVLGDLWGIKEDVWIQLWSGAVGAVVSAGVAALVAVVVLTRSNAHQRKLSEKQLSEQRHATSMAREHTAIADSVVAAEQLIDASLVSFDEVQRVSFGFKAAVIRWRLELDDERVSGEILHWQQWMLMLAMARAAQSSQGSSGGLAAMGLLRANDAVTALAFYRRRADDDGRDGLMDRLQDMRSDVEFYHKRMCDGEEL